MTGRYDIFRRVSDDVDEARRCLAFLRKCTCIIGHNLMGYDLPVLRRLLDGYDDTVSTVFMDTLILSRLIDYPKEGKHSIEAYGEEFGLEKSDFKDFSKYSQEMEDYCIRDVDICERVYNKFKKYVSNPAHAESIRLEHDFQMIVVNQMEDRGFALDVTKVAKLLDKVHKELTKLDTSILEAFPPRLRFIREITPKATKYGSISLSSIPKSMRSSIHELSVDAPFSYCAWVPFNPGSPKQIVDVLHEAGWQPEQKTKGHIDTERRVKSLERKLRRDKSVAVELQPLYTGLSKLERYGWKVNEHNLSTLPASAPEPARFLAKRILFESRRKTLTEWSQLVKPSGRVYGRFQGIGAWTHRMAHQKPNMANITNEYDTNDNVRLLGKELRQCWIAPRDRLLVGVDAEGIQLRVFAHYINDAEFTDALVRGKKSDKTDPHSLNQRILGSVCKSRAAAKRFIFALLLGAGVGKLSEILGCSDAETKEGLDRLLSRYTGWRTLKEESIPRDGRRGWFVGLDGRKVCIPGDTEGARRHLAMSGYLQNGEAVVMKTAGVIAVPQLAQYDSFLVNLVHDEFQAETPNNLDIAMKVAKVFDDAIHEAGERYNMNCPMSGSYWNDKHNEPTIGRNWYETH